MYKNNKKNQNEKDKFGIVLLDDINEFPNISDSISKYFSVSVNKIIEANTILSYYTENINQNFSEELVSLLEEKSTNIEIIEGKKLLYFISLIPNYYNIIKEVINNSKNLFSDYKIINLFDYPTSSEFKHQYNFFKKENPKLIIPKIILSNSHKTDILSVSKMFSLSVDNTLLFTDKEGEEHFIKYKGIETLNTISELESGNITIPSKQKIYTNRLLESEGGEKSIDKKASKYFYNNNENIILQVYQGDDMSYPNWIDLFAYSIKGNTYSDVFWTDIKRDNFPMEGKDLLVNFLSNIKFKISNESESGTFLSNFYITTSIISGKIYIDKIISGIHPFSELSENILKRKVLIDTENIFLTETNKNAEEEEETKTTIKNSRTLLSLLQDIEVLIENNKDSSVDINNLSIYINDDECNILEDFIESTLLDNEKEYRNNSENSDILILNIIKNSIESKKKTN